MGFNYLQTDDMDDYFNIPTRNKEGYNDFIYYVTEE